MVNFIPSQVPLPTFRPYPDYPQPDGPYMTQAGLLGAPQPPQQAGLLSQQAPVTPTLAQQPETAQNRGFMDFLRQNSDAFSAMGAGLLSGKTGPEQFGLGMAGFSQGLKNTKAKNATADWVQKNAPEYADLVNSGAISAADVFKAKVTGNDFTQRAAASKQYGLDPASPDGRNYILTGKLPGVDGGETYFGNPVATQGPDGSISFGQIGNHGSFKPIQLPDGQKFAPPTKTIDTPTESIVVDQAGNPIARYPKNVAGAEQQKEVGKAQGLAINNLPQVEASSNQMISTIDGILNDPHLPNVTGSLQGRLPNFTGDSQRVQSKIDQLKGQAFMQAYNTLRGGGAITDIEGQKATEAMARLNQTQNDEDFKAALQELRNVVQSAQERARARAAAGKQSAPGTGATSSGVKWSVE